MKLYANLLFFLRSSEENTGEELLIYLGVGGKNLHINLPRRTKFKSDMKIKWTAELSNFHQNDLNFHLSANNEKRSLELLNSKSAEIFFCN